MEHEKDECLQLNKTICGLVQSARQFFKKLVNCLVKLGFVGGMVDPCLMTKVAGNQVVIVAIYVDDCLFCGHEALIKETIQGIKENGFQVKVEDDLSDCLSCKIIFNKPRTKAWLGQPHLIKNLVSKFGNLVQKMQTCRTPGTPNQGMIRLKEGEDLFKVSAEEHALFKSGVGMLLYLVKHSSPDIANPVRELSKVMDNPSKAAMKELKGVVKFLLDTRDYGLRIEPESVKLDKWELVVCTDSDWAGDKDTRQSVTGYILFLLKVPILWKSKSQKCLSLSSSEAEFYALSEAAKDIKFVHMLMESMGFEIQLPIVAKVDNVGALFMTENVSSAGRTKHMDLRMRYVNKMAEEGFLKFEFVNTKNNLADGFTKNVNGETYEKHVRSLVKSKREFLTEEGMKV